VRRKNHRKGGGAIGRVRESYNRKASKLKEKRQGKKKKRRRNERANPGYIIDFDFGCRRLRWKRNRREDPKTYKDIEEKGARFKKNRDSTNHTGKKRRWIKENSSNFTSSCSDGPTGREGQGSERAVARLKSKWANAWCELSTGALKKGTTGKQG